MARRRSSSSSVARERLKLVLIHDRAGTSPSSNVMEMLRRDIIGVISKYFDVDETDFDVEIKNSSDIRRDSAGTQLTANIPIKRIKSLGPNRY
jgi:cell division topological specificity factor